TDVCDILCEHFETNFDAYVKYCSNQVYQDRTLKRLKYVRIFSRELLLLRCYNSAFMSCIQRLESDRQCQGLDMRSFLMLPMQRVTRYPLLVIAILDRIPTESEQHKTAQMALHFANHVSQLYVVNCCNEGARRMERTEQLLEIERRLVYKSPDLSNGTFVCKDYSARRFVDIEPVEVDSPKVFLLPSV
uniref:DH domain-containing protein n=1 Tax=Parascaris equorum TaxID=6256 RepID=A0A914S0P5_PAREQ